MSQSDYNNMLVAELKQELENFGLPTSGKKSELIERLIAHSKEPKMISIEADLIEDDSRYEAIFAKMKTQIVGPLNLGAIIAIGLSFLMISSVLNFYTTYFDKYSSLFVLSVELTILIL